MSLCPYQTITCKTVIVWEHNRQNRQNRLNGLGNSEKNGESKIERKWTEDKMEREILKMGDEES